MSPTKRFVYKWTRTLHVYLSLFSLLSMLFFAVTGVLLNHPDWLGLNEPTEKLTTAEVPEALVAEPLDKLAVAEYMRASHGATGSVETFDVDEDRIIVNFKAPGRSMSATINRENREAEIRLLTTGLTGKLTDLHKGQYAGTAWMWAVDISGVALAVLGLTGLVIWTSLKTRATLGFLALVAGTAALLAVYFVCVP